MMEIVSRKAQIHLNAHTRQQRLDATNFARGSVRYEGYQLGKRVETLTARYCAGELTDGEFIDAVLKTGGVTGTYG